MFERYTQEARRTIFFSRYEASQYGSPCIETEHLLLGLLREDETLRARLHADAESIRQRIEDHTGRHDKIPTSVDLPLSHECKRVLAYATEEADRLNHGNVGTEHLLLGLLRQEGSFAAEILRGLPGFTEPTFERYTFDRYTEEARRAIFFARYEASEFGSPRIETEHLLLGLLREDRALGLRPHAALGAIRQRIEEHTGGRDKIPTSVDPPLSDECQRVLVYAAEEAKRLNQNHIGAQHLMLGLLREENCFAAEILHERGIVPDTRPGPNPEAGPGYL